MFFHGNQPSWAIKHPIISLCFKYHSFGFIFFSTMLAPVISSLDEIYCSSFEIELFKDVVLHCALAPVGPSLLHR